MRKLIIMLVLISIPLFIFAGNSFLRIGNSSTGQNPQMQIDRAFRLVQHTMQSWSYAGSSWINALKYTYHYVPSTSANPDSIVFYSWDADENAFVASGVYHITYDESGQHITHMILTFTYGPMVMTIQELTFSYTAQGYLIGFEMLMQGESGYLEPKARMTIQYVSTSNYQVWNWEAENDDLVPQWDHSTFLWDAQGRIIQESIEVSLDSLSWVNDEKVTHEYIPGDNTTGDSFVNGFSHLLPLAMISDYNGPFYGKQSQSLTQSWNNNQWVNKYKEIFTYNAGNTLTNATESKWQGGNWVNNAKNDYLYDANNNMTDDTYSIWDNGGWLNDTRSLYDWSTFTANEDNFIAPQLLSLNAHPNPFNPLTTISYNLSKASDITMKVYNLKGEAIRTLVSAHKSSGNHTTTWDGTNDNGKPVSTGIYYIRMLSGNANVTRKVTLIK